MVMDVKQTYCGDRFIICTNTKSLHHTLEANIIYMSILSKFLKKKEKIQLKTITVTIIGIIG